MQLNGRAGHTPRNEFGSWVWSAGAGAGIIGANIKAKLRNSGGWAAQLFAVRPDGSVAVFGSAPETGDFDVYNLFESQTGSAGAPTLHAQLKCYRDEGCDLGDLGGATNRPDNILLTVRDWAAPGAWASGPMVEGDAETRWHRGTEQVTFAGYDPGSGVAGWALKVDGGVPIDISPQHCPGDRGGYTVFLRPCLESAVTNMSLDTGIIGNGVHEVQFCAKDFALPADHANVGCTISYTMHVDNEVPLQPEGLTVAGGEAAWHADNDFDLTWTNPSQGSASPIVASHHRLLDADGNVVVGATRIPGDAARLDNIQVPNGPGRYTIEVWLEDGAGNQGPPARAALRFDNVRPAPAPPAAATGWLSRTEIPYQQQLVQPSEPFPLSGIKGYAVSVDHDPSADPCVAPDRCSDLETDLKQGSEGDTFSISDLPEGTSFVHAAAVSGSGMKSTEVRHAQLRVDKTDPVTAIEGVPSGWSKQAVPVTASASDALSGMKAAAGDQPPFTAVRIDGGAPITSVGSAVSAAVAGQGIHTVAYYAQDLAGNVNDGTSKNGQPNHHPATIQVRIDSSAPDIAFSNSQNPNDPELIVAPVQDSLSGPDPVLSRIAVRRAGTAGGFKALPTEFVDGALRARWNSDAFPAGEYEFRATAVDRAGNSTTTGRRANGSDMVLPNPIKVATALRGGFGPKVLVKRRCERRPDGRKKCRRKVVRGFAFRPHGKSVRYGRGALFSGRLTAGLGTPLGDMPIKLVERFSEGSRRRIRRTVVRTDSKGIFQAKLRPGPSRVIRASFEGTRTLTRAAMRPARLRTRSGVVLRTSSSSAVVGGQPVVFFGRLLHAGALLPPVGKLVQFQFRLPSVPWTEFRSVRPDANRGRFRLPYRFSDPSSRGVRFKFRVFVPAESDWPFAEGASRPVVITGR